MNLKDELGNIEKKEIEKEDEDRLKRLEGSICWIHRRIYAIADYIDKEEREVWDSGYREGYEDGVNYAIETDREEQKEQGGTEEPEIAKKGALGLGKEVGDV